MGDLIAVAVGGALGAVSRHGLSGWVESRWGSAFPWGTLLVNVLGCALLGALVTWIDGGSGVSPRLRAALTTGLLGAFTTFSTFSLDTLVLWRSGAPGTACAHVALQLGLGLAGVALGVGLGRRLLGAG